MTNQYGCRWFFIPSLLTIIWFNGQGCQSFPIENGMVKSMENSDVGALLLNLQGNSHGGFSNEDVIAAVLNKTGNPLHRHLLSGDNTRDAAYDLDSEIQSMSTRSSSPWMVLVMLGGCMSVIVVVYAVLIQTSVQKDEVKRKNSCFYRLNMCMKCFRPSSTDIQQHTNYPVYMVKGIDCFRLGEEGIKSTELKYQTLTCLSEKNDDIYTERRDSGVECYSPTDELKQILNDEMLCTEIRGAFNCQGGMMFSENSDVKLIIPEGALHGEEMRELYVKVFVDVAIFATKMAIDDDSFIMTPIVECGPPGLQFEKPVQLIIPHRVRVHRDAKNIVAKTTSNLFRAFYSNKKLSNMATQNDIPINFIPHMNDACSHKPATSISFNVTGQFVNISTDHFTLFGCIGPRQKHNLHLQTFAYYNNSTDIANNRLLVQYRLYICSPDKDRRKSIEETEKSLGGRLCTPIKPFHLLSHHDVSVEIQLEQIDVWKLRRTPDIDQLITFDEFYDNSSSCVQFTTYRPLSSGDMPHPICIMGKFRVSQQSRKGKKETSNIYSQELELTGVQVSEKRLVNCRAARPVSRDSGNDVDDAEVLHKAFTCISEQLPPRLIRKFARFLGLSESTIKHIEYDERGSGAQECVYQILLKWESEKGITVSSEELLNALENIECNEIIEALNMII